MTSGPRYKRKTDGNQKTLLQQIRSVPGIKVDDVSMFPGLGYDLVARYQDGPPHALEVKLTEKEPLTDSEKAARIFLGAYWHRILDIEDVLRVFGIGTEPAPF